MFTAALLILAKTWKEPKCSPTDEPIKRTWYIDAVEYYSAVRRKPGHWKQCGWSLRALR